jgi:hypothetical protein
MDWRYVGRVAVLCFLAVCLIAAMADPAFAQKGDKSLAEKKGIEGLFQGSAFKSDKYQPPTPLQKYIGLGSFAVMIIVVKYL